MIDTFTLKFNEAELEIISSALADYRDYAESDTDPILAAMDDYRHYDDEGMDVEDLIGRTPVLARVNAIEEKISDAFANQ